MMIWNVLPEGRRRELALKLWETTRFSEKRWSLSNPRRRRPKLMIVRKRAHITSVDSIHSRRKERRSRITNSSRRASTNVDKHSESVHRYCYKSIQLQYHHPYYDLESSVVGLELALLISLGAYTLSVDVGRNTGSNAVSKPRTCVEFGPYDSAKISRASFAT